jgi:hypothetical protein
LLESGSETGASIWQSCIGMKRMASVARKSSGSGTSTKVSRSRSRAARFAVCVRNAGYEASLERNKIYIVFNDAIHSQFALQISPSRRRKRAALLQAQPPDAADHDPVAHVQRVHDRGTFLDVNVSVYVDDRWPRRLLRPSCECNQPKAQQNQNQS